MAWRHHIYGLRSSFKGLELVCMHIYVYTIDIYMHVHLHQMLRVSHPALNILLFQTKCFKQPWTRELQNMQNHSLCHWICLTVRYTAYM